jgi:uncharacterized OsmC-like protein
MISEPGTPGDLILFPNFLMKTKKSIKEAFEKKENLLNRLPSVGKGGVTTIIHVKDGTTCEIQEGDWRLVADMSEKNGGQNQGPTPGTFGRAAFGSCLAITYMMYASKMEIPIENLEVEVQVDYDARGMYGIEEVRAGYSEVRYCVRVESPSSEAELMAMLDKADKHSSYLDLFANETPVIRTVELKTKN